MVTLQSLLRDKAFYRDVAQLVAHYVRDVGVGRSCRLIPTKRRQVKRFTCRLCVFHHVDMLTCMTSFIKPLPFDGGR